MDFDDLEDCFEVDVDSIADEVEKLDDGDVGSTMKDLMQKNDAIDNKAGR